MKRAFAVVRGVFAAACACVRDAGAAPVALDSQPMPQVDLSRYMGRWHEAARYPNRFERGCRNAIADYSLRPDGAVAVLNSCERGAPPRTTSACGKAWSVHPTNSRLKVRFFWPFTGDYWIVALDPEYRWVMVGSPRKDYFWILSRSPKLAPELQARLFEEARRLGYDPARFDRDASAPSCR